MTRATARLFIAVDPPAEVCEQLAAWARAALGGRAARGAGDGQPLRVLDPELLHVTLCFLGSRPVADIEPIAGALAGCAQEVGELSLGAPLLLPPRRPRALAVEVHDPAGELARLHDALAHALAEAIDWTPEHRRFRAHVTLARMREGAGGRLQRSLPPTPALAFAPGELVLYRSWLDPAGASYEPLHSATLLPT